MKQVAIAALLCSSCIGVVAPSECALDGDCGQTRVCIFGSCRDGSRESDGGVCPLLKASYADINANLFQVGCSVKNGNCHSTAAVLAASGLDLSGDPYGRLVGVAALNIFGSCRCDGCNDPPDGGACSGLPLQLVKASDAQNSFLSIKLRKLSEDEQRLYGSSMPADHPGQLCTSAQAAVAQWIQEGAQRN